jgi:uncharacterized protein with PQ loop repeat
MGLTDILARAAAFASTASFAPQAVRIIRTRKTKDISLWMYVLTVSAFGLWSAFGILTRQWPLAPRMHLSLIVRLHTVDEDIAGNRASGLIEQATSMRGTLLSSGSTA